MNFTHFWPSTCLGDYFFKKNCVRNLRDKKSFKKGLLWLNYVDARWCKLHVISPEYDQFKSVFIFIWWQRAATLKKKKGICLYKKRFTFWSFRFLNISYTIVLRIPYIFSCVLCDSTPHFVGSSVCPSISLLVHRSIRHTIFFEDFFCFRFHCSCQNDLGTSITAPAYPHATGVAVYQAWFSGSGVRSGLQPKRANVL